MQHFVQSIRTTVTKPIPDLSPNRPFRVSLPACHEHKNYCTSSTLTFTRVAYLLEQQRKVKTNLSIFISTKFVKHRYAGEEKNNPRGNPCTRRPQKTAIKRAAKGPGLEKLQRKSFFEEVRSKASRVMGVLWGIHSIEIRLSSVQCVLSSGTSLGSDGVHR